MRILLIEDADVMAELVKTGLSEAGFTVDVARDGERGLRNWIRPLIPRGPRRIGRRRACTWRRIR
jgi:CheY-like chemotaxis protein